MRDGLRSLFVRDFDHASSDQRARNACAKEILSLIKSSRLHHRKNEIPRELFAEIINVTLAGSRLERLCFKAIQFLLLTNVRAKGNHFGGIGFL